MTTAPSIPRRIRGLVGVSILALAACTTGAGGTPAASAPIVASLAPAATSSATAEPSASTSASASEVAQATAVPTSIDPCQLVTPAEATTLTGAPFTAGEEGTGANNVKTCTYGQEGVVLTVVAAVAPDEATAKANEAATKADLEKNAPGLPIKVEELPGFAPGVDAAVASGSMSSGGLSYAGIAIYVLKGTEFFAITDIATLSGQAPTSAQLQDQAKVALGRLP
jgi:uncharacterized protein DUF3558